MNKVKIALILALLVVSIVGHSPIHADGDPGEMESSAIWVEEIRVSPSEILSDGEIAVVIQPYQRRYLTIDDLTEVLELLNQLYLEKGIVTARAILPPQTVEEGVVLISLVEGRVGDVIVEGNRYTQSDFIVERMSLQPGDLLDVAQLESDLLFFNAVYDVQLVASLESGEAFGTTNYIVEVMEPKRWSTEIAYANTGREDAGANQLSLMVVNRGLFGRSDPITVTLMGGEGSAAGSVAYAMPLGRAGGKLNLSFQQNRMKVVMGELADMDVVSESTGGGVGWRHPLATQPGVNVFFTADHRWLRTGTSILGAKLADQAQRGMTYGLHMELADSERTLEIRQEVTTGVYVTQVGEDQYAKYTGSYARRWRWKERYPLSFRFNWQLAGVGILPASEHFTLGGQGTVRGFPPGISSGENGYSMSLEIRRPFSHALEGFAFVEHGYAFPDSGGIGGLTSVGVGADFMLSSSLSGSLVYGVPLGLESPDLARGRLDFRASLGF